MQTIFENPQLQQFRFNETDFEPNFPPTQKWTKAEYYRMFEAGLFDDKRVELVQGDIIEMAAMNVAHATAVTLVGDILREAFGARFFVRIQQPFSAVNNSEPEPDIAVIAGAARDFRKSHPQSAALIVEISDTTLNFDRVTKAQVYAQSLVAEYWIVNLRKNRLEVFRQAVNGEYQELSICEKETIVSPLAAPNVMIAIADLLP